MSSVLPIPPTVLSPAVGAATDFTAARPLGFNCPACGVVLTIPDPVAYDGRPAPCPQCAVLVVPPRIFQPGEDRPEFIDLHPLPGLSARAGERIKMPRAVHRRLRHCAAGEQSENDWPGDRWVGVVLSSQP